MALKITRAYQIEAAHFLPNVPPAHQCSRMHGHTYRIEITASGPLDEKGFVIDFFELDRAMAPVKAFMDHRLLNDLPGLENPTAEIIAMLVFKMAKMNVPNIAGVKVFENPDCWAEYEG